MNTMRMIGRITIITVLLLVMSVCGYKLLVISDIYKKEAIIKDELSHYQPEYPEPAEGKTVLNPPDTPVPSPEPGLDNPGAASAQETDPQGPASSQITDPQAPVENVIVNQIIVDMQNEVNSDVVGWLTIPETNIDYPVVIAEDNDFYINRDIYGTPAKAGSIFIDSRCAPDFTGYNTVIYGHNMKNRSMFGDIRKFADPGFFDSNASGTLFVKNNTYTLEIFAYMVVRADDKLVYDPSADRDELGEYVKKNARRYREPQYTGNIVTLSTCAYEFDGARMVLLAVLNPINK